MNKTIAAQTESGSTPGYFNAHECGDKVQITVRATGAMASTSLVLTRGEWETIVEQITLYEAARK